MRPASALAQLTIWASTANAFYPFDPKWHLELVAEQSKRSLNGATAEGVTLPIKQRIPSVSFATSLGRAYDWLADIFSKETSTIL